MPTKLNIYGAGGHAVVVADAAQSSGWSVIRVVDDDRARVGGELLEVTVQAADVSGVVLNDCDNWHVAVGANSARRAIGTRLANEGARLSSVYHPGATIAVTCEIGPGCLVAARAVVAPRCVIETGAIINHGAIIDHDCAVGAWAHIAPGAILGGGVTIGDECMIGAGAVILPNVTVGSGATVGAGSVLRQDISANSTWAGCPAKRIRK